MAEDIDASTVFVTQYAVAFIDLLGQSEELTQRFLPSEPDETLKHLKNSVGKIFATQRNLEQFYDGYATKEQSSFYNVLSKEDKLSLRDMAPGQLKWQRFSDGVVVYFSLAPELTTSPINSICALLQAVGALSLTNLAGKSPIRAGIDIAWAVEYRPNELYGAAVKFAYDLESKVAQYPRAVVGEGLLDYLQTLYEKSDDSMTGKYCKAMVAECNELLALDEDGRVVVNFLSPWFIKRQDQSLAIEVVLARATQFAEEQHQKWMDAKCHKLTDRYAWLLRFISKNTQPN